MPLIAESPAFRRGEYVNFDDEPEPTPKISENTAVLSGKCIGIDEEPGYTEPSYTFDIQLYTGGVYTIKPFNDAFNHFHNKLEVGDDLKIRVYFGGAGRGGLGLESLTDILSHTRQITTKIDVSLDLAR